MFVEEASAMCDFSTSTYVSKISEIVKVNT